MVPPDVFTRFVDKVDPAAIRRAFGLRRLPAPRTLVVMTISESRSCDGDHHADVGLSQAAVGIRLRCVECQPMACFGNITRMLHTRHGVSSSETATQSHQEDRIALHVLGGVSTDRCRNDLRFPDRTMPSADQFGHTIEALA